MRERAAELEGHVALDRSMLAGLASSSDYHCRRSNNMEERIRVLIADNHPLFRRGLHGLLDLVTGIEVVGEATEEGCLLYSASILEDG